MILSRAHAKNIRTPRGPVAPVGRARTSKSSKNIHRRHVGTSLVIGVISIGDIIGLAVVTNIIVAFASLVVDVAMISRPPD
eukprot:7110197-Pyramimonas_sp.AAC.1